MKSATALQDAHYDYVIVSAGSAGCVMANRLSADSNNRVGAGGEDHWIWFHIPVGYLRSAISAPNDVSDGCGSGP